MSGLTIGLTAYTVNAAMVFVRVPTERGRYVLTDRCVVEVDCSVCGAVTGEPCRKGSLWRRRDPEFMAGVPPKHSAGVHVDRRHAARMKRGGSLRPGDDVPKVRIPAEDFVAAQREPEPEAMLRAIDNLISKARAESGEPPHHAQRTALARAELLVILGLTEPAIDIDVRVEARSP